MTRKIYWGPNLQLRSDDFIIWIYRMFNSSYLLSVSSDTYKQMDMDLIGNIIDIYHQDSCKITSSFSNFKFYWITLWWPVLNGGLELYTLIQENQPWWDYESTRVHLLVTILTLNVAIKMIFWAAFLLYPHKAVKWCCVNLSSKAIVRERKSIVSRIGVGLFSLAQKETILCNFL